MQYFATSATGFIGKRLVKNLLERKGGKLHLPTEAVAMQQMMRGIHF